MTIYKAYFRSDAEFARYAFEADTPEQALAEAQKFYEDDATRLLFQPYEGMSVNEIEIFQDNVEELAVWRDDELHLRFAAPELLKALEQAVEALNTAPRFTVGDSDSYKIASLCDRAIASAKGGRP